MKDFAWRGIGRGELAALLADTRHVSSSAHGAATIYRLERDGRQVLAIALPGGEAVVVEAAAPLRRRRRIDAGQISPASR
jgi:hypothetical protein